MSTVPPGKGLTFFGIGTLPRALDVVWCHFPTDELPKQPGPKPRPALVRGVRVSKDHKRGYVEVTYGTSKATPNERPLDLHICNHSEMNVAGLAQQTCFVLARTILLPWAAEYFTTREDGVGPVIGKLQGTAIGQLEALKVQRRQIEAAARRAGYNPLA